MDAGQLLTRDSVLADLDCANKKELLRGLAEAAGKVLALEPQVIFEALLTRERLGTTGLGSGIAIPHARLANLDHISGFFVRLLKPVDFNALDREPVDLVFALFAPAEAGADHLDALVAVSRTLRDEKLVERLRGTGDASSLYALLSAHAQQHAA